MSATTITGKESAGGADSGIEVLAVTTADCENTTNAVNIYDVLVPADSWKDGDTIEVQMFCKSKQNSGGSASFSPNFKLNSTTFHSQSYSRSNTTVEGTWAYTLRLTRIGDQVWYAIEAFNANAMRTADIGYALANQNYNLNSTSATEGIRDFSDWSSDIHIKFEGNWSVANALTYVRCESVQAYKIKRNV